MSYQQSLVFFLFCLGWSCGVEPQSDRIVRPIISAAFYEQSAETLEQMLQSDTANAEYIRLQLSYFDKLNWPSSAQGAVSRARHRMPLDPILARMYADFYISNDRYQALDDLFLELDSTFEEQVWMDRYKVKTFLEVNRPAAAVEVLEKMLTNMEVDDELAFWAGRAYLEAGDSASAFLHLRDASDAYSLDAKFLEAYLPLALLQGKSEEVVDLAQGYLFERTASPTTRRMLSDILYAAGERTLAKQLVWQSIDRSGLLLLSGWYQGEAKWDSAHYCLDRILVADSNDLEALLRKGAVDHSRGWLARATKYYTQVLDLDSTNVTAQEEQALIRRKIAYLRRIRRAQREIPVLDLNSKKEIN